MRLPPSQHHTGLLSTRARKSATAGGTGNSTSTNIKRAAPQAATLLRADSLGRRKAAMNMRGRSPPGTPPLTTAGFFITRLTGRALGIHL